MLLDCEEIVQEWDNWRRVNEEFLASPPTYFSPKQGADVQLPGKAFGSTVSVAAVGGPSTASGASTPLLNTHPGAAGSGNPLWRQQLLDKQDSHPPRAVQKAYVHPAWIPLARDWGGNNIAVDLAPGPAGKWGQVIVFGRDFDCKYVVARSWAAFLAAVADDFYSPWVSVDEDSGDLKLTPFRRQNVEPPYLQILRWRTDQKYGRRQLPQQQQQQQQQAARTSGGRRAGSGLGINVAGANDAAVQGTTTPGPSSSNVNGSVSVSGSGSGSGKAPARDSPYGSPKTGSLLPLSDAERGRPLSR
ncbi:Cell wall assembly regulator, partial [Ascosphaera acerosa]